ncbi:hypothetical protein D3C80_1625380 [compost metagenome]
MAFAAAGIGLFTLLLRIIHIPLHHDFLCRIYSNHDVNCSDTDDFLEDFLGALLHRLFNTVKRIGRAHVRLLQGGLRRFADRRLPPRVLTVQLLHIHEGIEQHDRRAQQSQNDQPAEGMTPFRTAGASACPLLQFL